MYEIWLGLNIVWELALMYKAWVIPVGTVVLIPFIVAIMGPPQPGRRASVLAAGIVGAVAAFFFLPVATNAGFGDFGYWVDWLLLLALSLAIGAAAAVCAAGLCALIPGRRLKRSSSW